MAKKISELTELTAITGIDYVELAEDDGAGGYLPKRWAPGTAANQNTGKTIGDIPAYEDDGAGDSVIDHPNKSAQRSNLGLGSAAVENVETQAGQGSQVIPITNSEGYLDSSWVNPAYGVRWDSVNDVMQEGVLQGGSFISSNYSSYPIQERCGRGLLTGDGRWLKLNPNDSTQYEDGTAASLDGTEGHVMVRIPQFYQLIMRDGDYVYFLISEQPFSFKGISSWIPNGFFKGKDTAEDYRYCGAFQGVAMTDSATADVGSVVLDTSAYTISYPNPFADRTRSEFRTQCSSTGAAFHQMDWGLTEILQILFITKYKTWNSQDVLPGHTERASYDYANASKAGETVGLGDYDGSIYDDTAGLYIANSFLGVEHFFGNNWVWVDGINVDNNTGDVHVYVTYDPADFADDTTTNYIDTTHAPGFGDTDNYIKDVLGQGEYCPFYPETLGGSSSTYITDYNHNAAGAWRVVRLGGAVNSAGAAGLFYLAVVNASSSSSQFISARLCG